MPEDGAASDVLEAVDRAFAQQSGPANQVLKGFLGRIFAATAAPIVEDLNRRREHRPDGPPAGRRARPPRQQPPPSYSQPPPRQPRRPPPPRPPPPVAQRDAREVLGFAPNASLTKRVIKERQRSLAGMFHPDQGGSLEAMKEVNRAAQELLAKLP